MREWVGDGRDHGHGVACARRVLDGCAELANRVVAAHFLSFYKPKGKSYIQEGTAN